MKSLDTNVLIRFLVNDDAYQAKAVRALFLKAEEERTVFFITSVVLLELLYVLGSVYEYHRHDIIDAVKSLISMKILAFENTDAVHDFLLFGKNSSVELDDLLIGYIAKESGCETTITFDKKASRSDLFELIK